ncbi:unnamed protein product [Phaedon cochleariae]|uniref:Carboxylesterase type B domain-containing protein n=1 Tax=Phaedon cochleariae TaxID=80249 RepID=A0A9P0GKU8_PHACE|nr:unnamed protein product [Phaedon cochleariae]
MQIPDTTIAPRRADSVTAIFCIMWVVIVVFSIEKSEAGVSFLVHKYSTRIVRTKYGPLRGIILHIHPSVEAFLGVPYATPPVGSLRYMPPVTPSLWRTTRLADRFSPVCPQRLPDISNRSEALLEFPKGQLLHLEKILPLLANQSEDCLYLNLYVPRTATGGEESSLLPCLVYVHGESYEWSSGNVYDGTLLASMGKVIVVTINFRLGVLGFVKTGTKGSTQGNFGLMDLMAGLHWLRENLSAFGGDPQRITLMGHGTGAALVNFIAVSPVARELLHRVILLSGSGLSPWALQRDPLWVKRSVAEHTGCHGDLLEDDLAPCLRLKTLDQLLSIKLEPPRFLPGFAPFIDGTILLNPTGAPPSSPSPSSIVTTPGFELALFSKLDLLLSVTTSESYLDLSAQDLEFGFNDTKRDRILRTYVRNSYYYHLNEIFSTLKNEYTDWERPSLNLMNVRDTTLDLLSDGHTVAPLIRIGYLHALNGGRTFFLHFQHHNGPKDIPMRSGSVRGDDLPFIFGLPLIGDSSSSNNNYSRGDVLASKTLINYVSNFIRTGDPNTESTDSPTVEANNQQRDNQQEPSMPFWDTYDTINQFYMELGSRTERKDHYRGHKMSLWLNLIPQLHRASEGDEVSMRHHHFQEEDEQYYDGYVRPQLKEKPRFVQVLALPPESPSVSISGTTPLAALPPKSDTALQAITTECPPSNATYVVSSNRNSNNLIRRLANSHFHSYTTALTVTIGVGCFLLLLNILIFAGIYHQKSRGKCKEKQKTENETASCSTSSGETFPKTHPPNRYEPQQTASYECQRPPYACADYPGTCADYPGACACETSPQTEVRIVADYPLREFKSSPKRGDCHFSPKRSDCHPPDVTNTTQKQPSDVSHPNQNPSSGILRPHGQATPGTTKKRVQIQEISV